MKRLARGAPLLVAALALGCPDGSTPPPPRADTAPLPSAARADEARRLAERAADELATTLVAALGSAIATGGTDHAVTVCGDVARDVAARVALAGVSVRRTALRLRNPANAPDEHERAYLEATDHALGVGRSAEASSSVVTRSDGARELRYLRPIVFPGGLCARCHGTPDEVGEDVRAALRRRYPDDQAIGFRPGDLRGAISIRVPLPD